jgi:cephalosporin hydroxylase
MTDPLPLISGDALKAAAQKFAGEMRPRVAREQGGLNSIFDSWFSRVMARLDAFDPGLSWEASVEQLAAQSPAQVQGLKWDLFRLRLFLDRWQQGRFVAFSRREASGVYYHPQYGTEFGADVWLTCQGAPAMLRWHGLPLMKNAFDFAVYPMLLGELKPKTVFEIGAGSGASAAWFADTLAARGVEATVHSVDRVKAQASHPRVTYHQGDCSDPAGLFDAALLRSAPHPWLVVEDAHHNVAAVLEHFHPHLEPGDYLVVEDSEIKRDDIRAFLAPRPGAYLVDTRFTDFFGRNATCAADSIFVKMQVG